MSDLLPNVDEQTENMVTEIVWFIGKKASINMMKDIYGLSPHATREVRSVLGVDKNLGAPVKPDDHICEAIKRAWKKLHDVYPGEDDYFYWYGMAQAWPSYQLGQLYSVIFEIDSHDEV